MNREIDRDMSHRSSTVLFTGVGYLCLWVAIILMPRMAEAYIGPGAGLTAIGTFVALLLIIILALVGFVWYPLKRAWKRKKAEKRVDDE